MNVFNIRAETINQHVENESDSIKIHQNKILFKQKNVILASPE